MSGTLRAEWLKLRTIRSTYAVLAVAVVLGLVIGLLELASTSAHWASMGAADKASFDPVSASFDGFQFGELAFGALGVLAITTEYGSGMIRATFLVMPRRLRVFGAKALVLFVFAFVACEVCAFGVFLAGQAMLSGHHLAAPLTAAGTLRAVSAAGLYTAVVTMVGFGLGALIRHTGGALAATVAVAFLAWPAARALDGFSHLPDWLVLANASDRLVASRPLTGPHVDRIPSLGFAYLDLALYLAVFLGLGAWRMSRDV
jgi:ABC-2 type transport system permease protein